MDAVNSRPMGGTEIMVAGLKARVGRELDRINLGVNRPAKPNGQASVVWVHHDCDQPDVQWMEHPTFTDTVDVYVFVSHWQRERFQLMFGLPPERCRVLRNAVEIARGPRQVRRGGTKFAYTSTPFRGLSVLLDAWEIAARTDADLHIWSSMQLYGQSDAPFSDLYDRARAMRGVQYHGHVSNEAVRTALTTMDFLAYPATWAETSCLSVIEAMAAGCGVLCPAYGALPETTAGFATLYPWHEDQKAHAAAFAEQITSAAVGPPSGQEHYTRAMYSWDRREREWRDLIASLS